jgi:hypothetical protein
MKRNGLKASLRAQSNGFLPDHRARDGGATQINSVRLGITLRDGSR